MKTLLLQIQNSYQGWQANIEKIANLLQKSDTDFELILIPVGTILGLEKSGFEHNLTEEEEQNFCQALAELSNLAKGKHILLGGYQQASKHIVYHYDPARRLWQIITNSEQNIEINGYTIAVFAENNDTEKSKLSSIDITIDFIPQTYTQRVYPTKPNIYLNQSIYIQLQPVANLKGKIYPGASSVYHLGKQVFQLPIAEDSAQIYDTQTTYASKNNPHLTPFSHPQLRLENSQLAEILQIIKFALRDFLAKLGNPKVIIGLSGGMDSALCLALAVKILGKEQVHTVYLPSEFSSTLSDQDTRELVRRCGVEHQILPINKLYQEVLQTLAKPFANLPFSVAEENIQSRLRALLLMALANKFNYILLNTSNKSELCMGYGTLYGDLCGGLGILGDLYKTQVYSLANYLNQQGEELIPKSVFTRAPSAELRPNQKDSDSLPEYADLDRVLFALIEQQQDLAQLQRMGIDADLLQNIWTRIENNRYKMQQICPILQLSPKPLSKN